MAFIRKKTKVFPWNVTILSPSETKPSVMEEQKFVIKFKRLGRKELTAFDSLPEDEALDLLDQLLAHAVRPTNVYEHEWRPGDLVLWDNAVVLHARDAFPNEENRLVKRMLVRLDPTNHIIPPAVN